VMQRHGQRAQLRFHQQGSRSRSKESFFYDSWHKDIFSPFVWD